MVVGPFFEGVCPTRLRPWAIAGWPTLKQAVHLVQQGGHQHPLVLPVRLPEGRRQLPESCYNACYSCNKLTLQDIV